MTATKLILSPDLEFITPEQKEEFNKYMEESNFMVPVELPKIVSMTALYYEAMLKIVEEVAPEDKEMHSMVAVDLIKSLRKSYQTMVSALMTRLFVELVEEGTEENKAGETMADLELAANTAFMGVLASTSIFVFKDGKAGALPKQYKETEEYAEIVKTILETDLSGVENITSEPEGILS